MKKGVSEEESFFRDIISMLIDAGPGQNPPYYCEATRAFLIQAGVPPEQRKNVDAAMNVLCTPPTDGPILNTNQIDYWQFGFKSLQKILRIDNILRETQLLPEERVPEAIAWMFVDFGRQLAFPYAISIKEATERTEEMMHLKLHEYQARAVQWRKSNPWRIIGFRGEDKIIGMSLILPITASARQRILNAEQMTYDCKPNQLCTHSHFLLHEGLAMRPPDMNGDPNADLAGPYLAVIAQTATLSRFHRLRYKTPLSVLSIAGTPVNRERQIAFGYGPTGKRMKLTNIEFVELGIERSMKAGLTAAILEWASRHIGNDPPPP